MKLSRTTQIASVLSVAALALTACGSDNPTGSTEGSGGSSQESSKAVTGTLTGIGASSQKAAMDAWKSGFESTGEGAKVQYSPDGSGAGRKAFLAGGAQFAGSDAYLSDEEFESSKDVCGPAGAFDIPAYVSPIAVAYNLEGVEGLKLDAKTIAAIFALEVTTWNDPAIADQNEGVDLPDTNITVVHRNDESGTTENFTQYLSATAGDTWTYEESGDWPSDLQSENAKGTAGVVSTTTSTPGAITYADASAVGELGTVAVKVGEDYTELSAEAAAKAVESAEPVTGRSDVDMALELKRDTTESGAYPISLVSYHIYCSSYPDQETVDLVKAWGNYVVGAEGQQAAADSAGSAPLSEPLMEQAHEAIDSIEVAS
ncbi:MAG: phosphate ABC transporter substrate-binding protein PstS [Arthrobacter sp.]|uniref:phosphate ABC transporter substrate-binding protein PstS n=1 Tax=unclassified Arthrobacter TaxID=235627 RepID=UPI002650FA76|nr:phosphate ABC transporter substrate-binding protein PstS [Micrococcaceae bacterium]MDN5823635.1 phosphate ABC transporter substrate-binding protein PstS [Micrococcaceae bacterium]MDN5878020.1 phosphate ABC transporter substrate-binding protein PstS [Micrococcaceae bacterium]MDN5885468.1 phosphate ABC transporter substrate-binding protein PstS [Micrococcaceae bacterium]MDN5905463.1 phosphate ABC transporter substrate-binding protein PstS [Micrococcaceae bacterium]